MDAMQEPNKLLKEAVDAIVHNINDNRMPAHAAVVKTAREMDLNVHFIKRACEVINVALTYEHFRKNAADRDSDFPIVDAQKVSAEIFPDTTPSLPEQKTAMFSGSMVEEEVPNFRKAKSDAKFKEAYASMVSFKEAPRGMSAEGLCEKAGHALANLHQSLDNCRTAYAGAKEDLSSRFSSLVNHWSKEAATRLSFAEFESQVFSRHGEAAVPYLDLIHKAAGATQERGPHDPAHMAFDDAPETARFGELLKAGEEVVETGAAVSQAAADLAEMEFRKQAAYARVRELRLQALQEEDPETAKLAEAVVEQVKAAEEEDPVMIATLQKIAASKSAVVEKTAAPSVGSALFGAFVDQYKREASPGGGSSGGALNNLDRKHLIQNLMVTDPILKTYEPKKVADAYEQFLRLAPELSNEKEIVRSHLRQMAASQAMTAFDGAQLMDANTKLLKQRQLESGARPVKEEK